MANDTPDFSAQGALRFGWARTMANLKPLLSLSALSVLLSLAHEALYRARPFSAVLVLGVQLLQIGVTLVLVRVALKLCDEKTVSLHKMEGLLSGYLPYLLALLIYGVVVATGLLLLIVPGIIWALRFGFAGFLVVDKNLDPLEAMTESSRLTRGVKGRLLGFALLVALANLLGALALGVGLFVTIPMSFIAAAHVLKALEARSPKEGAKQPLHGLEGPAPHLPSGPPSVTPA